MIIASVPIPLPTPEPQVIDVPVIGPLWQLFSPFTRINDNIRMMQMMSRMASLSEVTGPRRDLVTFQAPVTIATPLSFLRAREIIQQVEDGSENLNETLAEAENMWFGMLSHPDRISWKPGRDVAVVSGTIFLSNNKLAPSCLPTLKALAHALKSRMANILSFQISVRTAGDLAMAEAVRDFLTTEAVRQIMTTGIAAPAPPHRILLTKILMSLPGPQLPPP
jgi:hypothetical protein